MFGVPYPVLIYTSTFGSKSRAPIVHIQTTNQRCSRVTTGYGTPNMLKMVLEFLLFLAICRKFAHVRLMLLKSWGFKLPKSVETSDNKWKWSKLLIFKSSEYSEKDIAWLKNFRINMIFFFKGVHHLVVYN